MAISALTAVLKGSTRGSSVHRGDTVVARAVVPAPFDATPDGPTCAVELAAHQPTSGSLPGDQFDQYCEVRLAAKANDDTHKSMLSCLESWLRGQPCARLSFPDDPKMTPERNHMPHALVRARHHSDSMRWRRHVESAKRGQPWTTRIARPDRAKQSRHAVPPAACRDCSVRCGSKPWSVERCPRATSVRIARK